MIIYMKNGFLILFIFLTLGCESIRKAEQERIDKINRQFSDYCWKSYGFKGRYYVQKCYDRKWENFNRNEALRGISNQMMLNNLNP